jgi:hypothetical protein
VTETAVDKLPFVSLDDRRLPCSRAQIVHVPWGWQVELYHVPVERRPLVRQVGVIGFATLDGGRYMGTVIVDLITEEKGFVLLSGIGHLRLAVASEAA